MCNCNERYNDGNTFNNCNRGNHKGGHCNRGRMFCCKVIKVPCNCPKQVTCNAYPEPFWDDCRGCELICCCFN